MTRTNRDSILLTLLGLVLLVGPLASTLRAQTTWGNFEGTVTDNSGAVVPGAIVTVTNQGTNVSRSTTSNAVGYWEVRALNPGTYSVAVEMTGFNRQLVENITLEVNQTIVQDFTLEVGAVTQTVEVEATAPTLQTTEGTVGTVITNRDVVNLPLNGRSFLQLVNLTPGSYSRTQDQSRSFKVGRLSLNSPAVNGTRGQDNNYTLDGIENNELSWNFYGMTPSVDAIQEFKVQSSTTSGEFGRAAGANVNVAIKSGTNDFHGDVYEFLRNDVLDANGFFANREGFEKTKFKWNQFGATFGGPIRKNKTFFFGAYEGFRVRQANVVYSTVPTPELLAGDFTGFADIYDPLTTCGFGGNPACALDANGDPILTRTQFPNNQIPSDQIAQQAKGYLSLWPAPNLPGTTNNLVQNLPNSEDQNQFHVRVDHQYSDALSLFTRVSRDKVHTTTASSFPNVESFHDRESWNAVIGLNYTLSPVTNIDLKLGYNRNKLPSASEFVGTDRAQFLQDNNIQGLIGALPANTLPGIDVVDFGFASGGFSVTGPHSTWQGKGTYRHIMGSHSLSTGFDIRKNHVQYHPDDGSSGSFDFDRRTTADLTAPLTETNGSALASFMLGYPSGAHRILGDTKSHLFAWNYDFFVQDDWRVTEKLSLNLGVRYEFNQYPHDITDQFSSVQLERNSDGTLRAELLHALPNPYANPSDGQFEGVNVRRQIIDPDYNNFAPRFGIAYHLTPKTVMRAGYAIFYVSTYFQQAEDLRENFPLLAQQNTYMETTFPNRTMENAFGSVNASEQTEFGGWPQNKRNRNSYSQQWNFALEREILENTTLTATYVGQKGTKLIMYTDINNAAPDPGTTLTIQERRPVSYTTTGFLVSGLNSGENKGISSYNALQVKLRKRWSKGLDVLSSYTWGKSLDIQSSLFDNSQVQDQNNLRGDYGRSSWDQRQGWVTSFIYDLPMGKGNRFMTNASGVADAFLGGWRLGGIASFRTGPPLFIRISGDVANVGAFGAAQRPNQVGDPVLPPGQRTIDRWFNTDAFAPAADGHFGDFGRNVLDAPGERSFDFSLSKHFNFAESRYLEFRSEFFNVFNHPNFGFPGTRLGTGSFGVISSQANDPRQIQFALKFYF